MIPVISVVGAESNVGKTTVICKIIRELKLRNYKVATIKHHKGDFDIDYPEKDTWKHYDSGADTVIISSPVKLARIERRSEEYKLDEIISGISNVDIIITEGYKTCHKHKIEVARKCFSQKIISKETELFAVVTDFYVKSNIPRFSHDDIKELVDLIEEKFLNE
ncbi:MULTISPECIES: molybdopterin-guanine dinucleotide biosynthesis protein B [unclassified Sedimentibacter]|uniref:molybdopterin-guanine dinucleotide biosynthesis protein B n=1 Tax=unclassified Sedimentibacter TaxID=2649220 RepID=UPI0027E099E3|nr:molybdopterin-guanine dinucleotide biosynthesis protein B [Sedimentibacter sp. MB35-C1]WMJ78270.1 molybdopterin-guanine dinucleotide biosynthesis protein B [Sedimentibacter sp. MB35-C1]